ALGAAPFSDIVNPSSSSGSSPTPENNINLEAGESHENIEGREPDCQDIHHKIGDKKCEHYQKYVFSSKEGSCICCGWHCFEDASCDYRYCKEKCQYKKDCSGKVEIRTDIANIYNAFTKSKSNLDISDFTNDTVFTEKYTIFPVRDNSPDEQKESIQQAYYTSSGSGVLGEVQQVRPLIQALTNNSIAINILEGQKQNNGHDCGVYLIFYIKEILETQQPQLNRTYSDDEIATFRQF
ncbi:3037_t:CDS:2, partial [Racocetra persica]